MQVYNSTCDGIMNIKKEKLSKAMKVRFYWVIDRLKQKHFDLFWKPGVNNLRVTGAMFRRLVMETNLKNSNTMVCTPGYIWGKWGKHAYKIWSTGEVETYRERKRLWVSCA